MPEKLIQAFVLFFVLMTGMLPAGATLSVRHIDVTPGLSNTSINSVFKDSHGFLWIGTASGLFRYDGYSVRTFRGAEGMLTSVLNNNISEVQEDAEGRLWIDADNHWRVFDPTTGEETDNIAPILKNLGIEGRISSLLIDNSKNFWIGIEGKGIYSVRNGKVTYIPLPSGVKGNVTDMVVLPDESVEAVTSHGSLFTVNAKTLKTGNVAFAPESDSEGRSKREFIHDLYVDKKNRLWVFNNERLMLHDLTKGIWLNNLLPGKGYDGVVKSVFNDSHGNLWIARDHHGLEKIIEEGGAITFLPVKVEGGLTDNNTINCFSEDDQGTLWLGTYKKGLFSHNESVEKFDEEYFPDTNCIVNSPDGTVWLGTDNSGLWKWNPATGERRRVVDTSEGDNPAAITALTTAPDGSLYIGSFSRGLRQLRDGKFSHITTGTDLDLNYIWSLAFDREGRLWAGTLGGGLYRYNSATGETVSFKSSDSGLSSDYVVCMLPSRDGKMYFGTSAGYSVYDPSTGAITTYMDKESERNPGGQNVNQIYEDSRGLLWLATRNGLKVIDRERNKLFEIPLRNNINQLFVSGIIEDNGGSMWVTEGSNLINLRVAYDERKGDLKVTPHVYDSRDGLQNCVFNQRSFGKLPDGEILLGGLYGVNRFSPSEIRYNSHKPKVMFTGLSVGNLNISTGEEVEGTVVMKKGLNSGVGIEFSPETKEFTVYFASDNYALPEKTVFLYKLQGFNDEWTECAPGVNSVTYTNLSPGHYKLLVKAVNGDGFESESPAVLPIHVKTPFWMSPWAYMLYIALAALGIYMIFLMIQRRERRLFEEKKREDDRRKEEEINQLKFKFFTNVSHDLRTPLTLIISPLDAMLKETNDEKQTKRLTLMRNNAMKLLHLVNQLLDFRKMDMKGLQLNPSEGDIVMFARNVCNSFLSLSERKNINLTFYSDREKISMIFDPDKMEKILMNLLGNAFKFTPAGGRVDVSLICTGADGDTLQIRVADTGVGIDDKDKPLIFERFYQVDDNGNPHPGMGSGIGLSMVSEYVKLHNGTIRVADNVEQGSVFIIDIPIRRKEWGVADKGKEAIMPENATATASPDDLPAVKESSADRADKKDKSEKNDRRPVALVVDDNPDMTEMMKDGLDSDFRVITAGDGVEALEKVKETRPAIIVADLMMPRMDGIELTRRLKSYEATSDIPVIILTARHDLDVKVEGLTLGADDYITKPFNLDLVKIRMKRLVELTSKGMRRGHIDPEPEDIKITPLDEKFIGKAVEYVTANLDSSELSVEELSAHLGMSRVRLYKKIKQITGKTPIEFIRVIRLKRAAQLLRESQMNVSEIAYQTGFNNPKVFSKYFKEEFGILPSLYQDREGKETNYTV